jgi:hypothetical protein
MRVLVLEVAGYEQALFGLSLSMERHDVSTPEGHLAMEQVACSLSGRGEGHDKFLRAISIWLDVTAPRYWWSECDQYKVGFTTLSASTMHTIRRRELTYADFEIPPSQRQLREVNEKITSGASIRDIKAVLPESFLQRRVVATNYAALMNIKTQRENHKLAEWQEFVDSMVIMPYGHLLMSH